jgi:hypothetical protein
MTLSNGKPNLNPLNLDLTNASTVIYMAYLSWRIPIIAEFTAERSHLHYQTHDVALSEIFKLDYLSSILDLPIIEMHELKILEFTPQRLRHPIYDGEMPISATRVGKEDKEQVVELKIGDALPVEEPVWEEIGCWSFWLTRGFPLPPQEHAEIGEWTSRLSKSDVQHPC